MLPLPSSPGMGAEGSRQTAGTPQVQSGPSPYPRPSPRPSPPPHLRRPALEEPVEAEAPVVADLRLELVPGAVPQLVHHAHLQCGRSLGHGSGGQERFQAAARRVQAAVRPCATGVEGRRNRQQLAVSRQQAESSGHSSWRGRPQPAGTIKARSPCRQPPLPPGSGPPPRCTPCPWRRRTQF